MWRGAPAQGGGGGLRGQHRRLRPGVAVPPALPRTAGGVRVPPRGCAGVAAVLAHPHILPKAPRRSAHAGSRRLASAACGSSWRVAPAPSGAPWSGRTGRGGTRDHGLLPQRGAGRRPGCARRRPGGRRCLRCRLPRAAPWTRPEPEVVVNQLTSLAQSANPLAVKRGLRHDQPAPRARSRARSSPRPAARERAASSPRASRSPIARDPVCAPSPTRCGPTPRGRSASSPDHSPPWSRPRSVARDIEGVVLRYGSFYGPGTYFARDGLYTSMIAKRRLPIPGDGGGLFGLVHLDDAVVGHGGGARGPDRDLQRRRRRAGPGVGVDALRGGPARRQAAAPGARGRGQGRGRAGSWPTSCATSRPSPTSGPGPSSAGHRATPTGTTGCRPCCRAS